MIQAPYSRICQHSRLARLNDNFVRCLQCGQSMISQQSMPRNKTRQEFTRENDTFERNFERNFNNVIEETDQPDIPLYEYYTDRNGVNFILVDRRVMYRSDPPKYTVVVNGKKTILEDGEIRKILDDVRAVRIDAEQFKMMSGI